MSDYYDKYMEAFTSTISTILKNAAITHNISNEEMALCILYKRELNNYRKNSVLPKSLKDWQGILSQVTSLINIGGQ